MKKILFPAMAVASVALLSACGGSGDGASRSEIRVVGSSTVLPFAKQVADDFAKGEGRTSPQVESNGTGAGIELFCAGLGANTPDIANASRRMKASEFETCAKNGVTDIVEVQIGLDGIAVGAAKTGKPFNLTAAQVYKALAANPGGQPNKAVNWSDVDPSLPAMKISVYGPPASSGTRDAFQDLVLKRGCEADPAMKAMKETDKEKAEEICTTIRTDGAYVEQGENDNLIIQKLTANPDSLGIFGYSYLEENADKVRALSLDGVVPDMASIESGKYEAARPLFIYIKKAHVGVIPGLQEYATAFIEAAKAGGPLGKIGLLPSPADIYASAAAAVKDLPLLDGKTLK